MRFTNLCFALVLFGTAIAPSLTAQQPQPQLVVQAASGATSATPAKGAGVSASDDLTLQTAIKALQDARKVNEDLLKKQEATLQQLDELQKAAEQLRIFSKRG